MDIQPTDRRAISGRLYAGAGYALALILMYGPCSAVLAFQPALRLAQVAQTDPQPADPAPSQSADPQPAPPAAKPVETPTQIREKAGTPATVVDGQQLESVLGKNVRSLAGEDMGRIVDIIVDRGGQVRAAIIDFGGFLGVGSRKIAVDWRMIRFSPNGKMDNVIVDFVRDQLRVAPIYKPGEPVVMLGRGNDEPKGAATPPSPEGSQPPPK